MLKNYNELTVRYLKKHRKRSLFTVIGIVLAITLITLLCAFIPTAHKATLDEARKYNGDWHLSYGEVSKEFKEKVEANVNVEEVLALELFEPINIKNGIMTLANYQGEIEKFELISLKEGRLPENNNEIVLEDWVLPKLEVNIGDNISILGRDLKIVGVLYGDPYNIDTLVYSKSEEINNGSLYVKFKEDKNIEDTVEYFKSIDDDDNIEVNYALTSCLYNSGDNNNYSYIKNAIIIIIFVITSATVLIIYNAFNISVSQRTKELGILRTLGSTPKQISKLVRKEAFIMSLISIPIGVCLGLGILKLLIIIYNNISSDVRNLIGALELELVISFEALIISVIIGTLMIYLSVIIPAKNAGKISPLEALNNRNFIKKENIKRRKFKFLNRLFKIDKIMAYKNIRRNKGRYRITVISISISLIISISMYTFLVIGIDMNPIKENMSRNIDLITYVDDFENGSLDSLKEEIKSISGVEDIYIGINTPKYDVLIDEDKVNERLKIKSEYGHGQEPERVYNGEKYCNTKADFHVYDKKKLEVAKEYVKYGKLDFEDLEKNNKVILIENTYLTDKNYNKDIKTTDLKPGDKIKVNLQGYVEQNYFRLTHDGMSNSSRFSGGSTGGSEDKEIASENTIELEVAAVLKEAPFDMELINSVGLIITPSTAKYIATEYEKRNDILDLEVKEESLEIVVDDNENLREITSKIEKLIMKKGILGNVVNLQIRNANENNMILQIKILIYGFILFISILSAVNIINTINTNIQLRRKEFVNLISIGMPMKKIRNMILLEGALYGITSVLWGGTIGIIISYSMIKEQTNILKLMGESIVGAIIAIIIVMIVSVVTTIPGINRLKKINIIDELRKE